MRWGVEKNAILPEVLEFRLSENGICGNFIIMAFGRWQYRNSWCTGRERNKERGESLGNFERGCFGMSPMCTGLTEKDKL
jgi:hypothetical protein